MCYGHLDPKYALRDMQERLKDVASERGAETVAPGRVGAVLARAMAALGAVGWSWPPEAKGRRVHQRVRAAE